MHTEVQQINYVSVQFTTVLVPLITTVLVLLRVTRVFKIIIVPLYPTEMN